MVEKHGRDLSETQAALYDEGQQKAHLQMELDSKDSEIEQLRQKLAYGNIDSTSMNSLTMEDGGDGSGKLSPFKSYAYYITPIYFVVKQNSVD